MGKSPGLKLQSAIVQDNVPIEVAPRLFIGSIHAAFNVDALKSARITHIVNLAGSYATFPDEFTYCSVSVRDKEYSDLLSCLPQVLLFVDAALRQHTEERGEDEDGGVLIHCAGGRSRSPAIAIAYLITAHKLGYEQAVLRIRTARPVVSLNSGFETQLRCLEETHGDAFAAHQLLLQQRLTTLAQHRQDGQLDLKIAHHRRRNRHSNHHHRSPRTPKIAGDVATHSPHDGACDDRGMIHGRVPIGVSLSVPELSVKGAMFIPALRSAATLFGCRSCGEHLFCSSAIVSHDHQKPHTDKGTATGRVDHAPGDKAAHEAKPVKRPLLAKLRLKPHSPGGVHKNSAKAATISLSDPTTPRLTVLKKPSVDAPVSPPPPPIQSPPQQQQPATSQADVGGSLARDDAHKTAEGKPKDKSFWRTLSALTTSSKRLAKESSSDADKKKKAAALSPKAKAIDLSAASETEEDVTHRKFLADNVREWEHRVRSLDKVWSSGHGKRGHDDAEASLTGQLTSLVARENRLMAQLESHDKWLIEPQQWLLTADLEADKGKIMCPHEGCGAEIGQWCWEGLACSCDCGRVVAPAFQVNTRAIRTLGNVITAPVQLREGHEVPESVSCRQ